MKLKINIAFILLVSSCLFACKKDNYDAPSSVLSGRIVYNGEPIQVEYDRVPFQLFQYGFGKVGAINSVITEDGRFTHVLFDGEYKFVINPGQGPFLWSQTGGKADSVTIAVNGNTTQDVEVKPYYMIRNAQITGNSTAVAATFALEKVITDADARDVERVVLFLNKTQFVGEANQMSRTELAGSAITNMGSITLSANVPAINPTQNYVFARIGVKIAGIEDLLFSPVQKITY